MDPKAEESTDGSSIKPVSSLRSHFENMLSKSPPSTPTKSPMLRAQSKPDTLEEPSPRAEGRMSLDIPRGSLDRPSSSPLTSRSSDSQTPESRCLRPPVHSAPRARPTSMGPFAPPPQSPPMVTVQAPASPPKQSPLSPTAPVPTRVLRSPPLPPDNFSGSPPNGIRQARMTSQPVGSGFGGMQAPRLHSTSPPSKATEPRKPSLAFSDFSFKQHSSGLGPPPPVNRAGKPTHFAKPSSPNDKARSVSLTAPESGEEHVSPFSTPPSSDESRAGDESSPPVTHAATQEAVRSRPPRSSNQGGGYFGSRAVSLAQPARRPAPQAPPIRRGQTIAATNGSYSSLVQAATSGLPTDRPGLPPRKDISGPDTRQDLKDPPQRRSMDVSRRPSAIPADSSKFVPPPKRGHIPATSHAAPTAAAPINAARAISKTSLDLRREIPVTGQGAYHDDSDDFEQPADKSTPVLTDYPDSSQANRRPPYLKRGPEGIKTGYETKLFAVCGEYVCTSGYYTRVWNVLTGELLMSLSHGETVKMTAMAFKPASQVEDEGRRLWLGSNIGEIHEIDIPTQSNIFTKTNAHAKKEIIKIYRHASEMWSLDDEGKLHIWPADESGTPSLAQTPNSFTLPRGHSFSIVAGSQLWIATGKDIRVIQRNAATNSTSQVFPQTLCQPSAGDVTSGAIISSQPDRIYFGHNDGKVTVYSRQDYSCIQVINVSLYKISSLVGVGDYLWAGYNTGMVYVYDTTCVPWKVKKDWHAHDKPIAGIVADRSSLWKLNRLQVASLGTDNMVRLWDGMLREDWLEAQMQDNDVDYCDFREISALVMTWNAGASKPTALQHDQQDANFFRELLGVPEPPDILVFGFQELVDLEDKKVTAKSFFKSSKKKDAQANEHMSHQYRAWRDHLTRSIDENLPSSSPYTLLHTANLVGLFTCIFVKASERMNIRDVSAAEVKLGMGGLHGNKGALIVRFMLDDTSLCFINCHLAAGQTQTVHRNNDVAAILEATALPVQRDLTTRADTFVGGGDGSMILDHEICILNGDLNYRLDTVPRDAVLRAVEAGHLARLLERDQLLLSRRRNPGFRLRAFDERPLTFAPTYKYDVGSDRYDSSEKKRAPAWCDRLLFRGLGRVKQTDYRRHEVRVSDHRPVSGAFRLRVKTISAARRAVVRERCEREFEEAKMRIAMDIKHDYLCNVFGLSSKEAHRLLQKAAQQ